MKKIEITVNIRELNKYKNAEECVVEFLCLNDEGAKATVNQFMQYVGKRTDTILQYDNKSYSDMKDYQKRKVKNLSNSEI